MILTLKTAFLARVMHIQPIAAEYQPTRKEIHPMKHLVPNTNCSILSNPSKMPGYAFGLPAHKSCPRANGSICYGNDGCNDGCYAYERGFYKMDNVKRTQQARFDWTRESLRSAAGIALWIATMIQAILWATSKKEKVFRIHDSGDFFSPAYIRMWFEVCRQLPEVQFWAPTRVWQQPTSNDRVNGLKAFKIVGQDDAFMSELLKLAALPNVTIRPSALNFDDAPPSVPGLHAGSGASKADFVGYECPAQAQENNCGACRVCWSEKTLPVTYHKH